MARQALMVRGVVKGWETVPPENQRLRLKLSLLDLRLIRMRPQPLSEDL